MAIGHPGLFYDANRDMYYNSPERAHQEAYERELYRRKEEEYRRQQALMQNAEYYISAQQKEKLMKITPKPDLNDPLDFLQNTDKKLLLTGEMQ